MSSEDVNHKGILLTGVSFTLKSMSFLITIMLMFMSLVQNRPSESTLPIKF